MNTESHPTTSGQRRRILLAAGVAASAGGATWLATPGAHTHDWPQGSPQSIALTRIIEGKLLTIDWQGRPVWLLRRSPQQIAALAAHEAELTDPQSSQSIQPPYCRNRQRSLDPALFVAIGLCTHQGCTPAWDGKSRFLCPCHASRYDLAGRVFRAGPAPANLAIPAYRIAGDHLILGEDPPST